MKRCVFVGPSLSGVKKAPDIDYYGPAKLGCVFLAVTSGYEQIGVVDGYFGNTPSVWHKEILFALSKGVTVFGAASTGALRAAELWQYGMIGAGVVFRLYRRGFLTDDDEVCLIHGGRDVDFLPASEPMVNIRATLRSMRRSGVISRHQEAILIELVKHLHFSERTMSSLYACAQHVLGSRNSEKFMEIFRDGYANVKRSDALLLLDAMRYSLGRGVPKQDWKFPANAHWRRQFEQQMKDIPPLERC